MFILVFSILIKFLSCDPVYNYSIQESSFGYEGYFSLVSGNGPYGSDAKNLSFAVYFESEQRVHVKIYDPTVEILNIPDILQFDEVTIAATRPLYEFTFPPEGGFIITRSDTGAVIFNTAAGNSHHPFVFEKNFIQICSVTNQSPKFYGWGERRTRALLPYPFNFTFNNNDKATPADGSNLYGSHPFHVEVAPDGKVHGILFFNSAPIQTELENGFVTYRSMDGILDFYFFLGPTMKDVINQYTALIGRPFLVPHWATGFHQCHYGYESLQRLKNVVSDYTSNKLALDVIWADIDYMDGYRLFTNNPSNYPQAEFKQFIDSILQEQHKRTILIVDPGVKVDNNYGPYTDLEASGMFIRNISGLPFHGRVWPGEVYFPDFDHPDITTYWGKWFTQWLDQIPIAGVWLDMNELSSFCTGECDGTGVNSDTQYPWYPNRNILDLSVPLDAQTYLGPYILTHNFYGFRECLSTRQVLKNYYGVNNRTFILSRASFVGSGHNNAIWLGDNHASFDDLKDSIAGVITAGLYGIPIVGADIGGFMGNTWANLHVRWAEAAVFLYPFLRDHSEINQDSHEFYHWGQPYTDYLRLYLQTRQRIQSYIYTLMHKAHTTGIPLVRALIMEFPDDLTTAPVDTQALLGSSLLVSPVLEDNTEVARNLYFPRARWYDFWSGEEDAEVTGGTAGKGNNGFIDIQNVGLQNIVVHVRGGTIYTEQEDLGFSLEEMWDTPLTVVVALDENGNAEGEVIVDDHVSDDDTRYSATAKNPVLRVSFSLNNKQFSSTIVERDYLTSQTIRRFRFFGVNNPKDVRVSYGGSSVLSRVNYSDSIKVLDVYVSEGDGWLLNTPITISWV